MVWWYGMYGSKIHVLYGVSERGCILWGCIQTVRMHAFWEYNNDGTIQPYSHTTIQYNYTSPLPYYHTAYHAQKPTKPTISIVPYISYHTTHIIHTYIQHRTYKSDTYMQISARGIRRLVPPFQHFLYHSTGYISTVLSYAATQLRSHTATQLSSHLQRDCAVPVPAFAVSCLCLCVARAVYSGEEENKSAVQ